MGENELSPGDERALDGLVDPDREVDLSGELTGYPDDFEVYPGVRFGNLTAPPGRRAAPPR
jgi:hypothetical protein